MTTEAKFTKGSTMRHVVVMTATASVGLLSLFLVDALNLFYISLLGVTELAAAIGFAGTIQFFMISFSIGLMIAGAAIVSRAIGAGEADRARRLAGSSLITTVLTMTLVAVVSWIFREEMLQLLGADGEALEQGAHFLSIALCSIPLLGVGMATSSTLRAHGEARQAMYVTLGGGLFAAVVDPILIFGLDLGITGAALAMAITRAFIAAIGLYFVIVRHNLMACPTLPDWLTDLRPLALIAGPAMATQLSTPFGMAYLTRTVAESGDAAVAGWAVIGRIAALSFGGIFALAGAIGPIVGQNYGAKLWPRIASAYRDGLIFVTVYVLVAWALLNLFTGLIISGFSLSGAGEEVLRTFILYGAPAYIFTGALFVSNAAFNNLGRPLWSTGFNWSRDALVIPALVFLLASGLGVAAAVYIQAIGGIVVGTVAAITGWRLVQRIKDRPMAAPQTSAAPMPPLATGRAATVVTPEPLAKREENR
ncbi:MAG: MATE family efflux transporter [Pseudomonadota bacterium]